MAKTWKRWTKRDEEVLLRQVRYNPTNLEACFLAVSDVIDRSPKACAQHWYKVLSKDPNSLAFCNISAEHLTKNRKNCEGVPIKESIWNKFLRLIKNL